MPTICSLFWIRFFDNESNTLVRCSDAGGGEGVESRNVRIHNEEFTKKDFFPSSEMVSSLIILY